MAAITTVVVTIVSIVPIAIIVPIIIIEPIATLFPDLHAASSTSDNNSASLITENS